MPPDFGAQCSSQIALAFGCSVKGASLAGIVPLLDGVLEEIPAPPRKADSSIDVAQGAPDESAVAGVTAIAKSLGIGRASV
jgi:hypothetical protein